MKTCDCLTVPIEKKYMNTFCAISTSYISIFYYRCSAVIHTYFFVFIALVTLSSACCISRFSVHYEFAELPNAGDATMWTMARGRALRFSSFLFIAFYHYVFFSSVCLYPSQCECMELLLCHVTNSFSFCFSFFWPFLLFSHAQLLFFGFAYPWPFVTIANEGCSYAENCNTASVSNATVGRRNSHFAFSICFCFSV